MEQYILKGFIIPIIFGVLTRYIHKRLGKRWGYEEEKFDFWFWYSVCVFIYFHFYFIGADYYW